MNIPKLSATIITKNEEGNIIRCLEGLKWVDEIIIVDSYSSDNTIELCKKYTKKIYKHPFKNFSDQKNFAASKANNDWILNIDADEVVPSKLKIEIIQKLSDSKYDGFHIFHRDFFYGKWMEHGGWSSGPGNIRLYKKSKGHWEGYVHEVVKLKGEEGYINTPIIHFSHLEIAKTINGFNIYSDYQAMENKVNGRRINPINFIIDPFIYFFYKYFVKAGYKDGTHGLIVSVLLAFNKFLVDIKTWELFYKQDNYKKIKKELENYEIE